MSGDRSPAGQDRGAVLPCPALWHFRISHYNEKARWALDYKRVPHTRHAVLPGVHIPRVMWMTGQRQVPVLQLDGEVISDSTRIIAALERRYPHPPLYPTDAEARSRALALEDFFDEELGPHIRRAFFHHLLAEPAAAATYIAVGESALVRRSYRAVFPAIGRVMRLDMGIDDARSEQSRAKVAAAFDRLETEIQPSGYLVGNAFSVADLTAAALFSPLLQAPEFPYALPPLIPTLRDWCASFATRPGFQWARDIYRRHRGTSAERAS